MLGLVEGERQQGRPAQRWIDDVLMWCGQDIKGAVQRLVPRPSCLTYHETQHTEVVVHRPIIPDE